MTGSFGSLAVIVSATFKLYPVPHASRTVVVERYDSALAALLASQLTPTAVEIQAPTRVFSCGSKRPRPRRNGRRTLSSRWRTTLEPRQRSSPGTKKRRSGLSMRGGPGSAMAPLSKSHCCQAQSRRH
jgi:hypothetical protein